MHIIFFFKQKIKNKTSKTNFASLEMVLLEEIVFKQTSSWRRKAEADQEMAEKLKKKLRTKQNRKYHSREIRRKQKKLS
jgi:hypothetical protein